MRILCVVAHPDDEVLGCGGTLARLSSDGHFVSLCVVAEGITSRSASARAADAELVTALHSRCREVASLLGCCETTFLRLADNRLDQEPLLDVVKSIEAVVESVSPDVIYTHHGSDLNIDHVIVNRAVITACRPCSTTPVRAIYAFEVPSSTDWAFRQAGRVLEFNTFMDITRTLELKVQAMEMYETERRTFPHPRSPEAIRAVAQRWGSIMGCRAGEAFELVRAFGYDPRLRRVVKDDSQVLLDWRNQPSSRAFSGRSTAISPEEHGAWIDAHLVQRDSVLLIGELAPNCRIGYVRFHFKDKQAEISVALECKWQNRGYGRHLINRACELVAKEHPIETILARIHVENIASIRAFEAAGFRSQRAISDARSQPRRQILLLSGEETQD